MVDGLRVLMSLGSVMTAVHNYYSYLQDYLMRDYILINQKRRMESTESVTIKFMKDANNKAFGANTQRVKNRNSVVPLIDKVHEMEKVERYVEGQ